MKQTVTCKCGYRAEAKDDEELYSLARGHVDPSHPEMHRPALESVEARTDVSPLLVTGRWRAVGTSKLNR